MKLLHGKNRKMFSGYRLVGKEINRRKCSQKKKKERKGLGQTRKDFFPVEMGKI